MTSLPSEGCRARPRRRRPSLAFTPARDLERSAAAPTLTSTDIHADHGGVQTDVWGMLLGVMRARRAGC
jgi:hypothetical protein